MQEEILGVELGKREGNVRGGNIDVNNVVQPVFHDRNDSAKFIYILNM